MSKPASVRIPFILFILFVATIVVTSAITVYSDTLFGWVLTLEGGGFIAIFVLFLLLVAIYFLLQAGAKAATRFVGADVVTRSGKEAPKVANLIIGYSVLRGDNTFTRIQNELAELGGAIIALSSDDYEKAFKARLGKPPQQNPWQQNVRACWHHGETLKHVLVLENDSHSFDQFAAYMLDALRERCPNVRFVRISDSLSQEAPFSLPYPTGGSFPIDYMHYDYVDKGIRRAIQMVEQSGDRQGGIAIDVTPGQKTFSIAAAAITFNTDIVFSYVGNDGKLLFFDAALRLEAPPWFGG